jgi:hypothetical protein
MKWSPSAVVCVVIAMAIAVYPSLAEAHSPIKGFGTFYSHLLHPLAVPSHALLLTAAALMLGQQGRSTARIGFVALGLSFVVGLTAAKAGAVGGVREPLLLCGAFVIGGMVVLGLQMPALLSTLAAAGAGIAIGVDSATVACSPDPKPGMSSESGYFQALEGRRGYGTEGTIDRGNHRSFA